MIIVKNSDNVTVATIHTFSEYEIENVYPDKSVVTIFLYGSAEFDAIINGSPSEVEAIIEAHSENPGSEYLLVIEDPM